MKMKSNKAQIQTMETIAVLFIFFVLLMFGIVFYVGYARGRATLQLDEFHQAQSVQVAEAVLNLPELQDTRQGISSVNCFDVLKVSSMGMLTAENEDLRQGLYQERFKDSLIMLFEIYTIKNDWVLYNNTNLQFLLSYLFFLL